MNLNFESSVLNSASAQHLKDKGMVRVRVWRYPFIVAENLPFSIIIGVDFMSKTVLVIDLQAQLFIFKFRPEAKIPM